MARISITPVASGPSDRTTRATRHVPDRTLSKGGPLDLRPGGCYVPPRKFSRSMHLPAGHVSNPALWQP